MSKEATRRKIRLAWVRRSQIAVRRSQIVDGIQYSILIWFVSAAEDCVDYTNLANL